MASRSALPTAAAPLANTNGAGAIRRPCAKPAKPRPLIVGICILLAAQTLEAIIAEVIDRTNKQPDEPRYWLAIGVLERFAGEAASDLCTSVRLFRDLARAASADEWFLTSNSAENHAGISRG
jgi:hypothetical protein